jgi:lactose/cellobiose-specific phosphotransferase system IIC component
MTNNRGSVWLYSIRDGFITLLPLTFFGVISILLLHFPWQSYQDLMVSLFGSSWVEHLKIAINSSHGILSCTLAIAVSVHLTLRLNSSLPSASKISPLMVGISALMNFILFLEGTGSLTYDAMGQSSVLPAIIIGIVTTEVLFAVIKSRSLDWFDMPYDTDLTVYNSIKMSVPIIFTGLLILVFSILLSKIPPLDEHLFLPVVNLLQDSEYTALVLNSLATLINQIFWYLGVHGGYILDTYARDFFDFTQLAYSENFASRPLLNNFVLLGGAGATMSLLIAIALVVKEGQQRKIAQISILPSIFNINEPVLYGLPLVLNPSYLFPFIGIPVLFSVITVLSVQLGFLVFLPISIPWTTPPIISGWLITGSWHGALFQFTEIVIGTMLYIPFVKKAEKKRLLLQKESFAKAAKVIQTNEQKITVSARQDHIGLIARGLLTELKYDLQHNKLSLAYQPKHDIKGQIVGVEALLRWKHERHGNLPPLLAVNLAEENNEINRLGAWVIENACACTARWKALGCNINMAINISPLQLLDKELPTLISNTLQKYSLAPQDIELEITESHTIYDTPTVNETLSKLSNMGIRLAMDDFGMGHSSLLYMRRFKVHTLKIDGSLTLDVLKNEANSNIIHTIAELGRSQQIDIVAEYVETIEQRERLVELGCTIFQGYYHSKALSEKDCVAYFNNHV